MSVVEPRERVARQLMEAVERLQYDIARVELWASALGGFSQPVPEYDPDKSKLNQFILPLNAEHADSGSDSAPEGEQKPARKMRREQR